jgi:alpha-1,6-mannosyltransferase
MGGVGELIDDSVGQVAERANAQGMAQAIDALLSRDLHALSQAARERAETRHSWARTFESLLQTYARLTGLNLDAPIRLTS